VSIEEISQETGFSWRTVRNRLRDSGLYPLPADADRDAVLDAIAVPLPTYTEAELNHQRERIEELLRDVGGTRKAARKSHKTKGTAS